MEKSEIQRELVVKESKEEDKTDGGAELRVTQKTLHMRQGDQSLKQPCTSTEFQIPTAPCVSAMYPSLPLLDEHHVIPLCEEAAKTSVRGPAVLALAEQESSPPSLHPLESVAELSRSKLYPELPKTAPEIQVISTF